MSGRDRNLIILLLTLVVFYLCYTFVIGPYMLETAQLEEQLQSVESQLIIAEQLSGKEDELKKQEASLKEEITEKYSGFLTDIKQSRILYKVDTLAAGTGLPISTYTPVSDAISQVSVETGFYVPQDYPLKNLALEINPPLKEDGNSEETAQSQAAPASDASGAMIPGTDVSIGFGTATYESVYNFIGAVEMMNKTAFLRSVDLTGSGGTVQGQMVFSFYSLPAFDPDQKDGLDFKPAIPPGRANPFN
jgi:cell division protein FtsB